jgi:RecB family exonuclease
LRELGQEFEGPVEHGSHERWTASFGALRPVPPQSIQLLPLFARGISEISATVVDQYSRCGFWGLAGGRWKLWDIREPQAELWPEVRGNMLHTAVLLLMDSRDEKGNFRISCEQALEQAWHRERPKGLLRGPRLQAYAKKRLVSTLETFCAKEKEYFERSGTRVLSMEESEPLRFRIQMEEGPVTVTGRPDRIDEHPDGLFVIDYKTSSSLPSGTDMVDLGYRLQLPFYALAAQGRYEKPVLGVQYVELNRKGGRTRGIFFKNYNGKAPGNLTNTRARASLFETEPGALWSRAEEKLVEHVQGHMRGSFEARPKKDVECPRCSYRDLCGHRRKAPDESFAEGSAE